MRRLDFLFARVDCVEKDVITEVVDFGLNYTNTSDYDMASRVANISGRFVFIDILFSHSIFCGCY